MIYFYLSCSSDIQNPSSRIDTYIKEVREDHILYVDIYLPEDAHLTEEVVPKSKLDVHIHSPPQEQLIGKLRRTRYQYKIQGDPNSYVIRFEDIEYTNIQEKKEHIQVDPLFYDLDTKGPVAKVTEHLKPVKKNNSFWLYGIPVALIAFFLYRRKQKNSLSHVHGKSREEILIQDWKEATHLDDHSQSVAISNLMREYLSEKHAQPLTQFSQSEALNWLRNSHLPVDVKKHIENTITATDRLKFSREGGGKDFFEKLIVSRDCILQFHKIKHTMDAPS